MMEAGWMHLEAGPGGGRIYRDRRGSESRRVG